ncbi:hypothetical protein HPB48_001042 [Haemaphysalis longicornis]|uniref:Succinate dehydrogenase cytochrome b560 subunit, mitochondrial n=1 Tax=Haemaphysalis longicornis TaxID=44386 RepID=A0A9J6FXT9_HAELO|nr:hypothetical protein HPB48_001042 [Haemaphysalis longicornis]
MTIVLSLAHRATGVVLTSFAYGLAAMPLLCSHQFPYYVEALQAMHLSPLLTLPVKAGLAFTLFYHTFNGVRHLSNAANPSQSTGQFREASEASSKGSRRRSRELRQFQKAGRTVAEASVKFAMAYAMSLAPMSAMPPKQAAFTAEFFARNKALKRPLSPHLSIYAKEATSMLSLCHRATGLGMAFLTYGFGVMPLVCAHKFPHYVELLQAMHLSPVLTFPVKLGLSFALVYHTLNGMRHMVSSVKGGGLK